MSPAQAALIAGAGFAAGIVNTIAGAGSLLTFPALLATGLPPLTANVSNGLGVLPGGVTGAYGMRADLRGRRGELARLGAFVAVGSALGAVLLLALPSSAFDTVVPVLVGLAGVLVLVQPLVVRRTLGRTGARRPGRAGPAVGLVGVYSGYFGAAQGVLLIGVLGLLEPSSLRRTNATKNVLAVVGNGVAGLVYVVVAPVSWAAVGLLAAGSAAGGPVGAVLARRLPPAPLRLGIAVLSLGVAANLARTAW